MAALGITVFHLLVGVACLLAVVWWELYRGLWPFDPVWMTLALEDGRGSSNTVPPLGWLLALWIFLWWRGSSTAREESDFPEMLLRFFWGTTILVGLLTTGAAQPLGPDVSSRTLATFLLFGLTALAAARLEMAQADRLGAMDTDWEWRSTGLALALLAGGFGVALLLIPQLAALADWLQLWLLKLLSLVLEILKWIAHILGLDQPPPPLPATPGPAGAPAGGQAVLDLSLPDWVREVGRRLFDLSWIALILYAVYTWVRRWTWDRRARSGAGLARERMLWSLRLSLGAILLWLLRPLLTRWPSLMGWMRWAMVREESARTVRELYRRLLAWGTRRGVGREPWATPREYQWTLSARWPHLREDFHAITECYLRGRYGELATGEEERQVIFAAWQRIKAHSERSSPTSAAPGASPSQCHPISPPS